MPIKPEEIDQPTLHELADELLTASKASRITIRVDIPDDPYFPVQAEAVAPGTRAIKDEPTPGILQAPTFLHLKENKQILAQEDVETSPPVFPELVSIYGIRAQLLGPIVKDGDLVGILSIHHADGVRPWTERDYEILRDYSGKVHRTLGLDVPDIG